MLRNKDFDLSQYHVFHFPVKLYNHEARDIFHFFLQLQSLYSRLESYVFFLLSIYSWHKPGNFILLSTIFNVFQFCLSELNVCWKVGYYFAADWWTATDTPNNRKAKAVYWNLVISHWTCLALGKACSSTAYLWEALRSTSPRLSPVHRTTGRSHTQAHMTSRRRYRLSEGYFSFDQNRCDKEVVFVTIPL